MKKLILILLLFAGVSYGQRIVVNPLQNQFDSNAVAYNGAKATLTNAYPMFNVAITFNSLAALDSIKIYHISYYGDTTLQKFKMSTSDTLKTLLTGFSGVTQILLDNPGTIFFIQRVNAVLLTTRTVYIRQRGIYEIN